jgi:O-antigen/teichoic acid export membrane protein
MGNRTGRAAMGFVTDVGGQFLLMVAGFVAVPIILSLTSQSLYGFWLTATSILGYLALTDLGLGISLTRLVASLTGLGDVPALNRVISTAFFTFCCAGFIFFGIGISVAPFIPGWFKIPSQDANVVISAYRIAVFAGALALPLSVFNSILSGYQRMAIDNTVRNLISLITLGISILLLYAGVGLNALAISNLCTVLATSLLSYFYAQRCFPELKVRPSFVNRADLKRLLSFGGYFQVGRIANTVAVSTDSIVIAGAMGAAQVTPYAFSAKLPVLFSISLISKLPGAVFPAISQMFANQEMEKLRLVFQRLGYYSVRLAVIAGTFVFIANRQFVSLWVGSQYFGGDFLNAIFVYWVLQDTVYRGTTAIVYASGDVRNWSIVSIAEAVLNLAASLILVGPLGFAGVALGTSISKTLTTGWYIPYWICRKLNLPVRDFLKRSVVSPILRSLPGVAFTFLISTLLPLSFGWLWIIGVGLMSGIANLLLFEGLMLCKPSSEPWHVRIRQLVTFQAG